jgi:hypothetical protein
MTNSQQIPTTHPARKEGAVLHGIHHEPQLLDVHQRIDERIADAAAERLTRVAAGSGARPAANGATVKQRLGRRLIAIGEAIAHDQRPAADAGA